MCINTAITSLNSLSQKLSISSSHCPTTQDVVLQCLELSPGDCTVDGDGKPETSLVNTDESVPRPLSPAVTLPTLLNVNLLDTFSGASSCGVSTPRPPFPGHGNPAAAAKVVYSFHPKQSLPFMLPPVSPTYVAGSSEKGAIASGPIRTKTGTKRESPSIRATEPKDGRRKKWWGRA